MTRRAGEPARRKRKEDFKMTPKEGLSIAWAQCKMAKAMQEGKSDVECMTVLKEAYEDAMVLLGFSVYFDEEE